MVNIEELSLSQKIEIAQYIKEDTLAYVNQNIPHVSVRRSLYTCY